MSGIDVAALANAVAGVRERMPKLEQELNSADARLGDGDTGVMLARVIDALAQIDYALQPDIGAALSLMARKTAAVTGSSLGTLIATGLLTVARVTKGETLVPFRNLSGYMAAVVEAMAARGGARLGDKTVLDILDALARGLDGKDDAADIADAAMAVCHATLAEYRGRPCRMGRARMFAEKSIGLDDPGMLAVHQIVLAIAQAPPER